LASFWFFGNEDPFQDAALGRSRKFFPELEGGWVLILFIKIRFDIGIGDLSGKLI
jgi:hypothetical protein